ncbi:MAG: YicC family protein [Rhodobacteraceae bacterium]|nr:YicC family protein [Paracoccaceae bacterium]
MVMSMTGFASRRGEGAGAAWSWDLRSVNGKGFDLRLRLPDGLDGLEAAVRAAISRGVVRGNVSLGLRLDRVTGTATQRVDPEALAAVLAALKQIETAALDADVALAPASAADVLTQRGVLTGAAEADPAPLLAALLADLPPLLADFHAMRAAEGRALADVLRAQVTRIAALAAESRALAEARRGQAATTLREALDRVLAAAEGVDAGRVAQELALMAVKTDVTEELDRLDAHVAAARTLLAETGPVGRKLDFLMQEFNREANTLCSKSQSAELTRVGLDLKVTIDQMREQVQNVE